MRNLARIVMLSTFIGLLIAGCQNDPTSVTITDQENQSLGMIVPPQESCTRTIGYWKNHAGLKNQPDMVTPLLPIWLGDVDGDKSLYVDDKLIAVDILKMNVYGDESNGITKLYAQLLGAKLNIASFASDNDIADAITEADAFLAMYDWNDWGNFNEVDQQHILDLKDMFDNYNNGYIGPGHCDD